MGKIDLSENALELLQYPYLRRNRDGAILETPAVIFEQVASAGYHVGFLLMAG